jgi:predicted RNA-binding Zn ribbon-like protein
MTTTSDPVRLNISLPPDVAKTLREVIPTRQRARFVAQAVERELRRLQLESALQASAGAWQDVDHPELTDGPAIDRWIAEGRSQLAWDRQEKTEQ